ncbi:MAG: hypothetical protein KDD51_03960, partial [Bdellovibrionales bacterium]|nr:hypothetical protein [Bdellovibrionales bacterium]
PFFALMSRSSKRSREMLVRVSICLLIGHWLDLFLMIGPKVFEHAGIENPSISPIDIGIAFGFGGVFVLVVAKALSRTKLLATGDPFYDEGLALNQ